MARVAARQGGVIDVRQLRECGVSGDVVARWVAEGRLHRVYRGVYAVGHPAIELSGRLHAALLHAGSGAALSHQTAAWWWRLSETTPSRIHVAVAGEARSLRSVRVHRVRAVEATVHRSLPLTTVARTLRDLAVTMPFPALRRALAEADYRGLLDRGATDAILGRGRNGSTALRAALEAHYPELARTRSVLEERFLSLCQAAGLPAPLVNVAVAGITVDALWPAARLVVELDGHAAHDRVAAAERDRARDLVLRRAGYRVHRYTWRQVTESPELVVAELRETLRPASAASASA